MLGYRTSLIQVTAARLAANGCHAQRCFDEASEVVIFGSMSTGLDGPDSDIDILCVGESDFKVKTDSLDLIAIPVVATTRSLWLESELASHIVEYGTWIKGSPRWTSEVQIGQKAIDEKRRRIAAYMKFLPDSWLRLNEVFRVKYSVRLRRETQRLLLLEKGTPVPPTRILDSSWSSISISPYEVHDRLSQLTSCSYNSFIKDLFGRIATHFDDARICSLQDNNCHLLLP